jgi:micrococcal nuclease
MMLDLLRLGAAVGRDNSYAAVITGTHDGDTVYVQYADVFLGALITLRCRLIGINARELRDPGGAEARAALAAEAPAGTVVTLRRVGGDEYRGRVDAQVITEDGRDLSAWLCSQNWAAPWNGRGERPVPPWPRPVPPA